MSKTDSAIQALQAELDRVQADLRRSEDNQEIHDSRLDRLIGEKTEAETELRCYREAVGLVSDHNNRWDRLAICDENQALEFLSGRERSSRTTYESLTSEVDETLRQLGNIGAAIKVHHKRRQDFQRVINVLSGAVVA